MNRPQLCYNPFQRIIFVQTFYNLYFRQFAQPVSKLFSQQCLKKGSIKNFLRLRTCIYTVKMVLKRVIYKYYNSWKGAKRYRTIKSSYTPNSPRTFHVEPAYFVIRNRGRKCWSIKNHMKYQIKYFTYVNMNYIHIKLNSPKHPEDQAVYL